MPQDIDRWIDGLSFTTCKTGVKLDLRIRVYPNGHGYLISLREDGRECPDQPVNNVEEAINALRRLWSRGMESCPQSPEN